jgi:hypothetical protein
VGALRATLISREHGAVLPPKRGGHGEELEHQALRGGGGFRGAAILHGEARRLQAAGESGVRRARRRVPRYLPPQERGSGRQVPGSRPAQ